MFDSSLQERLQSAARDLIRKTGPNGGDITVARWIEAKLNKQSVLAILWPNFTEAAAGIAGEINVGTQVAHDALMAEVVLGLFESGKLSERFLHPTLVDQIKGPEFHTTLGSIADSTLQALDIARASYLADRGNQRAQAHMQAIKNMHLQQGLTKIGGLADQFGGRNLAHLAHLAYYLN